MFYLEFWKKYFDFNGKVGKKDFFVTLLINILIFILYLVFEVQYDIIYYYKYVVLSVFVIPTIAMFSRRLNDTGRNAFYLFWLLLPVIGFGVLMAYFLDKEK